MGAGEHRRGTLTEMEAALARRRRLDCAALHGAVLNTADQQQVSVESALQRCGVTRRQFERLAAGTLTDPNAALLLAAFTGRPFEEYVSGPRVDLDRERELARSEIQGALDDLERADMSDPVDVVRRSLLRSVLADFDRE